MNDAGEGGASARRDRRTRGRFVATIGACAGIGYMGGRVHQDLTAATWRRDTEIALVRKFLGRQPGRYDHLTFNRGRGAGIAWRATSAPRPTSGNWRTN